jgi:membrane protease YdiL (CAAX protease family)
MFVALTVVLVVASAYAVPRALLRAFSAHGQLSPGFITINELVVLLPVTTATAIMAWLEGRSFFSCGLGGARRLRRLMHGVLAGFALLILLTLLLVATGHAALAWGGLGPGAVLGFAVAWGVASLLTGLAEELALRGYLLQALQRGLGFWPALSVTSLAFGALHISNTGEGVIGVASATMGGAILALGVRGTGSLWWSIGLHSAWDYAENFLAGTPDSGQLCAGTLLRMSPLGPSWASGGPTGPEGSVFALALLAAGLALAWHAFKDEEI